MRKLLGLAAGVLLLQSLSHAEIYTIYSDKSFPASTAAFNVDQFCTGLLCVGLGYNGNYTGLVPPEGFMSFSTTVTFRSNTGFAGWAFDYGSAQDLSRFQSGEFRFWIYSSTGNIEVAIKQDGLTYLYRKTLIAAGLWDWESMHDQWVDIHIPLSNAGPLGAVEFPCVYTALSGPATFYIDNVRYVDSTASPIFDVSIHNLNDNNVATNIQWGAPNLPAGWVRADQYLKMDVDADALGWGVQIYTDNTSADASPKFATAIPVGQSGSNPAGLVDTALPGARLTLAWSVKAATYTVIPPAPEAPIVSPPMPAEPNNNGLLGPTDPNASQWIYIKDRATHTIASENTTAFADGQADVLVRNNRGIHFGQAPTDIGAENPPNFIYLETNFSTAVTPRKYQTSALRVEFYHQ